MGEEELEEWEDLEEDYLRKTQRQVQNNEKMRVSGKGVFTIQDQINEKNKKPKTH